MESKEKKKGFANTHYPGIVADPNESQQGMPRDALEFYAAINQRCGESAQKKLWNAGVLLFGWGEGSLKTAELLFQSGVRRVGILEMMSDLAQKDQIRLDIKTGFGQIKTKMSWVELESFLGVSIDRDIEDILRGFQVFVNCSQKSLPAEMGSLLRLLRLHETTVAQLPTQQLGLLTDFILNCI